MLKPGMAVAMYLATPLLLTGGFLMAWDYPPLWVLNLLALGPPVIGGAVLAAQRLAGKAHRPTQVAVGAAWAFAAIYTVMRTLDIPVLDRGPLFLVSTLVGVVAAGWLWGRLRPDPTAPLRRAALTLGLGFFALGYAFGTGALINIQVDIAPTQHFTAKVIAKRQYDRRHRDWKVTLAPWGPVQRAVRHSVWPEAYALYETGGVACVDLHRGLLGLRWVDVAPCEPFVRRGR